MANHQKKAKADDRNEFVVSGCQGRRDFEGDFDCGYQTTLMCEDCKYGIGRKDPAARCNALHPEKIVRVRATGTPSHADTQVRI